MNIRLSYNYSFISINVIGNRLIPNTFNIKLHLTTLSEDPITQNVAFDRIRFFINEILQNGIFISSSNPKLPDLLKLSPDRLIILPEDPFDQVIGMALFCKFNAIMSEEMILEELEISSDEGADVIYHIDETDNFTELINVDKKKKLSPWWTREDLTTLDTKKPPEDFDWSTIGLDWEQENDEMEIDFEPDEAFTVDDKPVELDMPVKNFNPTVIAGGASDKDDEEK